jgi:hypothetical protein
MSSTFMRHHHKSPSLSHYPKPAIIKEPVKPEPYVQKQRIASRIADIEKEIQTKVVMKH